MANKKKVTTTVTTTVTEETITVPSNEKTQIICILDRSGSMGENGIIYESINGFNNFLNEQKKLKDNATLTIALFDDRYELLYDDVDIKKVENITYDVWYPRGTTALFDAIGKTINTVIANRNKLGSEKPDKVLVCIVTDGKENASHEYNRDKIKSLIKDFKDVKKIPLSTEEGIRYVAPSEIIYIKADGSYSHVKLSSGASVLLTGLLKNFEEQLCNTSFFRVSKSFLINMQFVKMYRRVDGGTIEMTDNTLIPVPRRRRELFILKMSEYLK